MDPFLLLFGPSCWDGYRQLVRGGCGSVTGHFGRPLLDFIFFFRSASRARPGSFRFFFLFESLSEDFHGGCTERLQVVVSGEQHNLSNVVAGVPVAFKTWWRYSGSSIW